mmetsp:Transcript_12246/g.23243  ORF Transcript_12246/g.23243 Transcript_12246/m.23243 type:complete len:89 (+) Transcript_12246:1480-1746(+)
MQDEFYDRKLERMLPYPEQHVGPNWTDLKIRLEAEKWCKPFTCPVQRCLSRASKVPEDVAKCELNWTRMERCFEDVAKHIKQLRDAKQ